MTQQGQADGSVKQRQGRDEQRRRSSSARPRRRPLDKDWKQLRTKSAPPQPRLKKIEWSPLERKIVQEFTRELAEVLCAYVQMTDEEVEDEYRRAGKLHKYDPLTEMEKRHARLLKQYRYRYRLPSDYEPRMEEYMKLIEDEDDD